MFSNLKTSSLKYANPENLEKAEIFIERFREIVSDPLNILIDRVATAGYADKNGCVILHNGNRVPIAGKFSYYGNFSDILVINRGVHEPLEEFCFQETLKKISDKNPKMIELGAYWAHYSMWLLKKFPSAVVTLVEPNKKNMACGMNNFRINGYKGEFINAFVSKDKFQLDGFIKQRGITSVDILHADIQGFEEDLVDGGKNFFQRHIAKYIFISTHSQVIHNAVVSKLRDADYIIEISSDPDQHSTSHDGFVLATAPNIPKVFCNFRPLGRVEIAKKEPVKIIDYLVAYENSLLDIPNGKEECIQNL